MSERDVLVSYEGSLQIIKLNRPEKKNALTLQSYSDIRKALKTAVADDKIKITLLTGNGDYFSSGNDFSQANATVDEDMEMIIKNGLGHVREFIRALIDHPKIIIALVNGPAMGVAVTMLALFDIVYALDTAAKMLYFNYKMTAVEAKSCGFVADILTKSEIPSFLDDTKRLAELPLKSLMYTKEMMRSHSVKALHYSNAVELEKLAELFQSEDFMNAMLNALYKKKSKI